MQSLNNSWASLSKIVSDFSKLSHTNSSTDTIRAFAIFIIAGKPSLLLPVSILLMCEGDSSTISESFSCVILGLSFFVALMGVSATSVTVVQAQEAKWTVAQADVKWLVTIKYKDTYGTHMSMDYVVWATTSSEAEARGEAKCIQEVGSSGAYIAKIVSVSAIRD